MASTDLSLKKADPAFLVLFTCPKDKTRVPVTWHADDLQVADYGDRGQRWELYVFCPSCSKFHNIILKEGPSP